MRRLNPVDISLYFILGPDHWGARDPAWLVREAVAGGASLVQLRDKRHGAAAMIESARALKAALDGTGVPLIVNDRVDVAMAAGAEGVNLGREDMRPLDARRLMGPDAIIGVTVKTVAEAEAVDPAVIDYASIGGVFPTGSKHNPDPPIGLDGLAERVRIIRDRAPTMPISAIAGIDMANAAAVAAAGADGVALVSAIAAAENPRAAAAALIDRVAEGRTRRQPDRKEAAS